MSVALKQAAPVRAVALGPSDIELERRADGSMLLRSPHPLGPYPAKLTERLDHWARVAPHRTLFAQRSGSSRLILSSS